MPKRFGKVGVLYGGHSSERAVSLRSGEGVHRALRSLGVDAHLFDTRLYGIPDLIAQRFDRVFIALHGGLGENGAWQGLLEVLGIPYTGSGVMASAIAMDKLVSKRLFTMAQVPTPAYCEVRTEAQLASAVQTLGMPLVVKAPQEGSTLGLVRVMSAADLPAAQALLQDYPILLAEAYVAGRELTVAVLGKGEGARALPVVEIIAPNGHYDFQHKYLSDATRYLCPAPHIDTLAVQTLALNAYRSIGCAGWARVDILLDAQGQCWVLEINTAPGMTDHSLVPMAAQAEGVDYARLCWQLLEQACVGE